MKHVNRTRALLFLWCAITLALVIAADPPNPTHTPEPIDPPFSPPIVAAWLQRTRGVPGPLEVIIAPRINNYNEISPHSYTIERDGSLTVNDPVADAVMIDYARVNGIRYIPTVSTGWDNGSRLLIILSDPKLRADHVHAIMKIARQPGVGGIDLDYENLPPEARSLYTTFVNELAAALHQDGKILSVTVPPKERVDDSCVVCQFADYAAIGAAADRFRVMGYEFHGPSGGPGPVAPAWWLRQVMSYTVSVVPHAKVSLGIHLYGYDWGGDRTTALWWNEVQALKDQCDGVVSYPTSSRGPIGEAEMTYTITQHLRCPLIYDECLRSFQERHTVWFVDARYIAETTKIVDDLGLGGIVMWRPGGEDPAIWNVIAPPTLGPAPRFDHASPF